MLRSGKILTLVASLYCGQVLAQGVGPVAGGGGGGTGTVTNIATSCGVSGGPITTTGTISGITTINPETGANYPIVSGDCGKLINLSNAAPQIPTIPSGTTLGAGWFTEVCNQGAGTQTITPAAGTIGGAATFVLAAGTAAAPKCTGIVSDGTNLQLDLAVGGGGGSGTVTTTGSPANGNLTKFSGATSITNGDLSGDCVTSSTLATVCNNVTPRTSTLNNSYFIPAGQAGPWASGSAQATNTINCTYGAINRDVHIDSISALITTTSNGNNIQLAVYTDVSGRPGALVAATGNMTLGAGTGALTGSITSTALGPGTASGQDLWWCINSDNATVVVEAPNNSGSAGPASTSGSTTLANALVATNQFSGVSCAGANCNGGSSTFNTWPTLTGSTWSDITSVKRAAIVAVHIASVP